MPNVPDAVRFIAGNFADVERFVGGDAEFRAGGLMVATRHGPLWVAAGEWIVRGADGRFTTSRTAPSENGCGNG